MKVIHGRLHKSSLTILTLVALGVASGHLGQAQTLRVLHTFVGAGGVGQFPMAGLVRDTAGNLYGTTSQGGTLGFGTAFKLDSSGHLTVLHNFAGGGSDGANPDAAMILDSAGNLFGTTSAGGVGGCDNGCGTVFKIDTSGRESLLYEFAGYPTDGATPESALVFDKNDNLYGTTYYGGPLQDGTVFKLTPNSNGQWTETVLYNFTGVNDGTNPASTLIFDGSGNLYGTTVAGGGGGGNCFPYSGCGTVFKLSPAGVESVLYAFMGLQDGGTPYAGLLLDGSGNLYGTTSHGGAMTCSGGVGCGTVFRLDVTGKETVLYSFMGQPDGAYPYAGLIQGSSGNFYGTTSQGGASCFGEDGCGVVFEVTPTGTETVLYSFPGSPNGATPYGSLVQDSSGNLYGTTFYGAPTGCYYNAGCGTIFTLSTNEKEAVLYRFPGPTDGAGPFGGALSYDSEDNLYGTTMYGGNGGSHGAVFRLSPSEKEVIYGFVGYPTDGQYPYGGVIRDGAGNLYGTTNTGGNCNNGDEGCGTVFKISAVGKETVLHNFGTSEDDGQGPSAGVIRDSAGNLYGTTTMGGAYGAGTIFQLDPSGNETILHSFIAIIDGGQPKSGLLRDAVGNLYGTTFWGGGTGCEGTGCGTVFKLDTSSNFTVLYTFTGGTDGAHPVGNLIADSAGNLYGTTSGSEFPAYYGTVFKLTPDGALEVLYTFAGPPDDGGVPLGGPIRDDAGNLYGTTSQGGGNGCLEAGCGTVFKLDPAGKETILYRFSGTSDGSDPDSGLLRDAKGNLYGSCYTGGTYNHGTLFRLTL